MQIMIETLLKFDGDILFFIQNYIRNDFLTPFFRFITSLGNSGMIWIIITLLLLIFKKTRKIGAVCALALIGSLIVNNMILKNLVARVRPYDKLPGLNLIIEKQTDWSFPSGHAGSSFACAWSIYRNAPKKYGIPALILAILIALSRLYVGVHYPSDVLIGIITGILVSCGGQFIVDKIAKRAEEETEK